MDRFSNQHAFLVPVVLVSEGFMAASWHSSTKRFGVVFVLPGQSFWRQLRLSAKNALPLLDAVFVLALTLFAWAISGRLDGVAVGILIPLI